ncbi:MAG: alpha/beta fold hydrolase [Kiloniellales bacterium]
MAQEHVTRKLTAILAADVVGYSRLMGVDEAGTLAALKAHRAQFIDPKIAEHHGRTVKLIGDGALVEFASVVDAVACAVDIQRGMAERNAELSEDRRIEFRIGVNLGDVIVEGDDIYGDGVNVSARLEGLAKPGGICVSVMVYQGVAGKLDLRFVDLGERKFKNIDTPVRVYQVELESRTPGLGVPRTDEPKMHQEIRFCMAPDGVRIAYATVGQGPALVKPATWLNHLELDWEIPGPRRLLHEELAKDHLLVRYDERGNGLSDWDVDEISFEAFIRDLETVVDAIGLERFALFGISQGCAISIAYAVKHPERVTGLVLYGGFARGWRRHGLREDIEQIEALITLMRQGWGQDNPAFRQIFTSLFMPDATPEQVKNFNDLQRMATSPENAVRIREAVDNIDISHMLPKVAVPTLVLHCRDDAALPFEEGRRMAAMIPRARFVPLEGRNHIILENEPAWPRFLEEATHFLANLDQAAGKPTG